jgi:hypothetical protein
MKLFHHNHNEIRFCDGRVSNRGMRQEAAREAAQLKALMANGWRLV